MKAQSRKKSQLLRELENNPIAERACRKIGIARSTYYRWIESDEAFKEMTLKAQEKGRAKITDFAESKLMENMSNNHFPSLAYWLSHNTARYRAYPKNIYIDEIRQLRMAERALEDIGRLLATDAGYDALKRLADSEIERINRKSPLGDS